jgi:hypothetical protein
MLKPQILGVAIVLIGALGVGVFFLRNSEVKSDSSSQWVSVDDPNLTDSEKRFVANQKRFEKEGADQIKKTLIDGFSVSVQRNAPDVGDQFPHAKIIDTTYQKVLFKNKITALIIGQGTAKGAEQIAKGFKSYIENKSLNLIRIVTSGKLPQNSLATAVIDARNPEDKITANTSPGKVASWLGLPRSPVAYLIDQNGVVVYSKFSGGYTDPDELPKYIDSYLIKKLKILSQRKSLSLNQRVELTGLDFVPKSILEKYLKPKSGTTVLIFTQPECNSCEGIRGGIVEGTKKWQQAGNGVILINADPAVADGYDEKNGALNISDNKRKMMEYFKIDRWPHVIFLHNQQQYGDMDYTSISRVTEFVKFASINNDASKRKEKTEINNKPFMESVEHAIDSLR